MMDVFDIFVVGFLFWVLLLLLFKQVLGMHPGWPHNPPLSASQVLEFQACATVPDCLTFINRRF
jgi:hypothetical protein